MYIYIYIYIVWGGLGFKGFLGLGFGLPKWDSKLQDSRPGPTNRGGLSGALNKIS